MFSVGADYYGVADLSALAADTHKFESRYLDGLVGPWPAAKDVYDERSPIHHVDGFDRPLIVFQGLDDQVVPPNQSEMIVAALQDKAVRTEYHAYEDEEHGLRQAANITVEALGARARLLPLGVPHRSAGLSLRYPPSAAASSAAMSSFFIAEHRLHRPLARRRVGVVHHFVQPSGTTCHERPYLSFSQPHWPSSPPSAELGPVVVDLVLVGAVDQQRDRLVEGELRTAVDRGELLAVEHEVDGEHACRPAAGRPRRSSVTFVIFEFGKIET